MQDMLDRDKSCRATFWQMRVDRKHTKLSWKDWAPLYFFIYFISCSFYLPFLGRFNFALGLQWRVRYNRVHIRKKRNLSLLAIRSSHLPCSYHDAYCTWWPHTIKQGLGFFLYFLVKYDFNFLFLFLVFFVFFAFCFCFVFV